MGKFAKFYFGAMIEMVRAFPLFLLFLLYTEHEVVFRKYNILPTLSRTFIYAFFYDKLSSCDVLR